MKWARIENNTVREIFAENPEGKFHKSLLFKECGEEVRCGWTYDGQNFSGDRAAEHKLDPEKMSKEEKDRNYKIFAQNAIAENYSLADEIKLLRRNAAYFAENGINTEEFDEYSDYAEQCVESAFEKIYSKPR